MHKQDRLGFTIIELIVVIVTMGILLSITINVQIRTQARSHDSVRNAHMTILSNELEKFYDRNGEYPPGCPDATCTTWFLTENTSAPIITPSTNVSTLRTVLPGIRDDFGDPQSPSASTPFMLATSTMKEYYYYGGTVNKRATASTYTYSATPTFPCSITSTLSPSQAGSYVIGYYDEETHSWVLTGGRNGVEMSVTAGYVSDGCVINRG